MEKLKLEIRLLFGSDIDSTDACIERLLAVLMTKSRIESAHLAVSPGGVCRSRWLDDQFQVLPGLFAKFEYLEFLFGIRPLRGLGFGLDR